MATVLLIRKRARTAISEPSARMDLQAIIQEIHQLRKEHARREQDFVKMPAPTERTCATSNTAKFFQY